MLILYLAVNKNQTNFLKGFRRPAGRERDKNSAEFYVVPFKS